MCKSVSLVWNLLLCTVSNLSTNLSIAWETKRLRTYRQACVLSMVWNSHVKKKKKNNKNQMWPCVYFGSWDSLRLLIGDSLNHSCLWLLCLGKGFSFHCFFFWGGELFSKILILPLKGLFWSSSTTDVKSWATATCIDCIHSPLTMTLNVASSFTSLFFWACSYVLRGARGTFLHWNLKMF